MLGRFRNTYAEIDLKALEQNYFFLKSLMKDPKAHMAPMVKADAYGHGDIQVARVLEKCGARYLGVSLIEEAVKLRMAGIQTPILFFGFFDHLGAEALVRYQITPVINGWESVEKLMQVLHGGIRFSVHLEFNTGMNRLGFEPHEARSLATKLAKQPALKVDGLCTHFLMAEDFQDPNGITRQQIKTFEALVGEYGELSRASLIVHYLNSVGLVHGVTPQLDMARPGIGLYGAQLDNLESSLSILPVMSIKTVLGAFRRLEIGEVVSYGARWKANRPSLIGVLPIGYGDGVPRSLSGKGRVLIHGESCPMVGTICMDYLMVDLTDLEKKNVTLKVGDEVVFLGQQKKNKITVEEIATSASTISYEILTGIQNRVPRVYLQ